MLLWHAAIRMQIGMHCKDLLLHAFSLQWGILGSSALGYKVKEKLGYIESAQHLSEWTVLVRT